jgi:hypothetical protein
LGAERAVGPASPLAVVQPNHAVGFANGRKIQLKTLILNIVKIVYFIN